MVAELRATTDNLGKMIYLARRNPNLTHEQFIRRWRQHGAFSMGLRRWRSISRYTHCEVLDEHFPAAARDVDGVACIWFHDDEPADPHERELLRADERETFSTYVRETALFVRQRTLLPGPGTVKLTRFVCRQPGLDEPTFVGEWAGRAAEDALTEPARCRLVTQYVQNTVAPQSARPTLMPYDVIEEMWFAGLVDAGRYLATLPETPLPYEGLIDPDRSLSLLTDDVVMYDFSRGT